MCGACVSVSVFKMKVRVHVKGHNIAHVFPCIYNVMYTLLSKSIRLLNNIRIGRWGRGGMCLKRSLYRYEHPRSGKKCTVL